MNHIKSCDNCSLCQNQPPLLQNSVVHDGAFFVGLSAVKTNDVENDEPFSEHTKSGNLLRSISGQSKGQSIYFTNIVKCLPLNGDKIRYPNKIEMESCLSNFEHEIDVLKPRKIILFGKKVSDCFCNNFKTLSDKPQYSEGFSTRKWRDVSLLLSPHPSYILIYKRKQMDSYKKSILSFLAN